MNILCNGCSFTYGDGFLDSERESKIWPSILAHRLGATVTNIALPGSSNLEIFLRTLRALDQTNYDLVIIQWTALRRHWFEPGLDRLYLCAGNPNEFDQDWEHKNIFLKKSDRKKFHDIFSMLTGDYRASMDVAIFCKTLMKLQQPGKSIVFVNGLLPWTPELITPPDFPYDMANVFSKFTKDMLEFDTLNDDEIYKWFDKLHNELKPSLSHWVNADNAWIKNRVDHATVNRHPGTKSHIWMADQVQNYLVDQKLNNQV